MTFPTKLMRLQFGGPAWTTESWSCSLHFTTADIPPTAEGLSTAVEQFMTNTVNHRPVGAKLSFVKFNELDHITGKYANPGVTDAKYYGSPIQNGVATGRLPQGSQCITLTTAIQRGRGHSGRIYLPGYAAPDATGHVGSITATDIAVKTAEFINAITLFEPSLTPVVWSKIGDLVHPVTGVKVGSVVDTQRRRRTSLPEVYYASTTPID